MGRVLYVSTVVPTRAVFALTKGIIIHIFIFILETEQYSTKQNLQKPLAECRRIYPINSYGFPPIGQCTKRFIMTIYYRCFGGVKKFRSPSVITRVKKTKKQNKTKNKQKNRKEKKYLFFLLAHNNICQSHERSPQAWPPLCGCSTHTPLEK